MYTKALVSVSNTRALHIHTDIGYLFLNLNILHTFLCVQVQTDFPINMITMTISMTRQLPQKNNVNSQTCT
jgi:hypothetical protein